VVNDPEDLMATIARLESHVAALERRLADRSREIRALASEISDDDLIVMSRMAAGWKPLPGGRRGSDRWVETTVLTPADVERTLEDLWRSTAPQRKEDE
jgi:hypothetical protein